MRFNLAFKGLTSHLQTSWYFEIAAYRPRKTADIGFNTLGIEDTQSPTQLSCTEGPSVGMCYKRM